MIVGVLDEGLGRAWQKRGRLQLEVSLEAVHGNVMADGGGSVRADRGRLILAHKDVLVAGGLEARVCAVGRRMGAGVDWGPRGREGLPLGCGWGGLVLACPLSLCAATTASATAVANVSEDDATDPQGSHVLDGGLRLHRPGRFDSDIGIPDFCRFLAFSFSFVRATC